MSGIGTNYSVSTSRPYFADPAKQPAANLADSMKEALKAEQDAYQKHWDEARQAVAQLNTRSQNYGAEQKAIAAQKVQYIKDQIKMLTMMGGAGNPKANARQIAQLAKELAAAVHEYASASNSNEAPAATANSATQSPPNTTPSDPAPIATESATATDTSSAQDKPGMQSLMAGLYQKSQGSDTDQAFIREVRDLAEKLKALARQQQARMQQEGSDAGDISKIYQATDDIAKGLSDIVSQVATPSPQVNLFA